MKVKNVDGQELTPKQIAEEILMDSLHNQIQEWYTIQSDRYGLELSEKEQKAVNEQMNKIGNRLAKVLHYEVNFTEIFKERE